MNSDSTPATRPSLLLRVRDLNDAAAWRDFVECYTPGIFAWCRSLGLQESDAADAAQAVLLKLVRELRRFEYDPGRGRFRSWLRTVTRHAAADLVRGWRERAVGGSSELAVGSSGLDDPAEQLFQELEQGWRKELVRRAEQAIQLRVHAATWRAWKLTTESIPTTEVARQCGLSISEVYVARSRVLRMLKDEVRQLESEMES